jgi:hypothetical protein
MGDTAAWIDQLRPRLERTNLAILAALEDYATLIARETPTCWVDLRDEQNVAVYAIADGWLHIFTGTTDQPPTTNEPNASYTSICDHEAAKVTCDATLKIHLVAEAFTANSVPHGPGVKRAVRRWMFQIGGHEVCVDWPAPTNPNQAEPSYQNEPETFARKLADTIRDNRRDEKEASPGHGW